jgi:hypothetical protein
MQVHELSQLGRNRSSAYSEEDDQRMLYVGSTIAADVYTWGNGMLGQLGLGRRGTSKGRLLPTLIHFFSGNNTTNGIPHWRGAIDACAGHNFTVCVGICGRVFSWGHAEYNQHGTGGNAASDHVDAFYFYEPRQVNLPEPVNNYHIVAHDGCSVSPASPQSVSMDSLSNKNNLAATTSDSNLHPRIAKVNCGATFTVAIDSFGNAYSWGWNESGVLGHGIGHFGSKPKRIATLGVLTQESAGTNNVVVEAPVCEIAAGAKHVIALSSYGSTGQRNNHYFFRELLEHCPYADCHIKVTDSSSVAHIPCHRIILACRSPYLKGYLERFGCDPSPHLDPEVILETRNNGLIDLSELPCANSITVKALLEYVYMDKVNIAAHKRRQLSELASYLCLHRLVALLRIQGAKAGDSEEAPPSTFVSDFRSAFNNPLFADVMFPVPTSLDRSDATSDAEFKVLLYAHKVFLCQLEYFQGLFSCGFVEMQQVHTDQGDPSMCKVPTDGFIEEGMSKQTLLAAVLFAYTGEMNSDVHTVELDASEEEEDDEMTFTMNLLLASNRFSFHKLATACERHLVSHLRDYFPDNAINCLQFAKSFGFTRLERKCEEALRRGLG